MVGLLILKHLPHIPDKRVIEQWSENVYYQYFCGEHVFLCRGGFAICLWLI